MCVCIIYKYRSLNFPGCPRTFDKIIFGISKIHVYSIIFGRNTTDYPPPLDHRACSEVGVRTRLNNWHRYFQSPLNPITNTAIDKSLQAAMGSMQSLDWRLVSGKVGMVEIEKEKNMPSINASHRN